MNPIPGRRAVYVGVAVAMIATSGWAVAVIVGDDRELRTGPVTTTDPSVVAPSTVAGGTPVSISAVEPVASTTAGTVPAPPAASTPVPGALPSADVTATSDPEESPEGGGDRAAPGAVAPPFFEGAEDTSGADAEAATQSEADDAAQHAREAEEVYGDEEPFAGPPPGEVVPRGNEYGDELVGGG